MLFRSRNGLHLIAAFEAAKGAIVLALSLGLFNLMHRDVQEIAMHLVAQLGLHPGHKYSEALLHFIRGINQSQILGFALIALAYSAIRFVEAYGLWKEKSWAKWLAILSGALYLPYEFYHLYLHFTWIKVGVTVFNILLVLYLVYIKVLDRRSGGKPIFSY